MKIAHIVPDLSRPTGVARVVFLFSKGMIKRGHDVRIYTDYYNPKACFPELAEGLDIAPMKVGTERLTSAPRFWLYRSLLATIRLALFVTSDARDADILIYHRFGGPWFALIAKRKLKKPIIWFLYDARPPRMISKQILDRAKQVLHKSRQKGNSLLIWKMMKKGVSLILFGLPFSYMDRYLSSRIDKIVVLDEWNREFALRYYSRSGSIELLRCGIDLGKFNSLNQSVPSHNRAFRILCVSVLHPHRRLENAILALKTLVSKGHNIRLKIVGSTERSPQYYEFLCSLVKTQSLGDRVEFAGEVSDDALVREYRSCDCFLWPNVGQTWGLAVLEAMASRKPVVVSEGSGVSEVLTHEENALLVPPDDPDAIAKEVERLITDRELYKKVSEKGYQLVASQFTIERSADHLERIITELVEGDKDERD